MSIESRIDRLEQVTGIKDNKPVTLVVVESWAENFAQLAEAEYRAEHPDFQGVINIIAVLNEQSKQLTERIIAGEKS